MTETLSYRMVQFCPSPTDDIRINIGVEVSDGFTRHVEMLSRPDLQSRCKTLSGSEPLPNNAAIGDLFRYASSLSRYSSKDGFDVRVGVPAPSLLSTPERFNNLLRLSAPRNVVFGELTETAEFLLRNLAPVTERQSKNRVRTTVRKQIIAGAEKRPTLVDHILDRPTIEAGSLASGFDFGFHDFEARAIGRVFNFDRAVDPSLIDSVSSTVLMFERIRKRGATASNTASDQDFRISRNALISVVYTEPKNEKAHHLFEQASQEWKDLDVLVVPTHKQGLVLDEAERALSHH